MNVRGNDEFNATAYLDRLGIHEPPTPSLAFLERLQQAHFESIVFENFSMRENARAGLTVASVFHRVVHEGRGGICHETAVLMTAMMERAGFDFYRVLASVHGQTRGAATHQIYVVRLDDMSWVMDIGYGAMGPRGVFPLVDGGGHSHGALSTSIARTASDRGTGRWLVSVTEHASGMTVPKPIYSFVDAAADQADIDMAHFFTVNSPQSLLNRHRVASRPTPTGRMSIRDTTFTIVESGGVVTRELASADEVEAELNDYFGVRVHLDAGVQDLGA